MSSGLRSAFSAVSRRSLSASPKATLGPARMTFYGHNRSRGFTTAANEAYAGGSRGPSALRRWTARFGSWRYQISVISIVADRTGILLAIPVIYVAGAVFPPQLVLLLYPRYSPPPPDKDSTRGKAITCEVEQEAQGLSIVEKMRAAEGWYETSQ
jgi:hypothetical protein